MSKTNYSCWIRRNIERVDINPDQDFDFFDIENDENFQKRLKRLKCDYRIIILNNLRDELTSFCYLIDLYDTNKKINSVFDTFFLKLSHKNTIMKYINTINNLFVKHECIVDHITADSLDAINTKIDACYKNRTTTNS